MANMYTVESTEYIPHAEVKRRVFQHRSYNWWDKPADEMGDSYIEQMSAAGIATYFSSTQLANLLIRSVMRAVESKFGLETRYEICDRACYKAGYSVLKGLLKKWGLEDKKLDCRDLARLFVYHDEQVYGALEKIVEYEPDDMRVDVLFCPVQICNTSKDCELWNGLAYGMLDAFGTEVQWGLTGGKILTNGGNACQFHIWIGEDQSAKKGYPPTATAAPNNLMKRKVSYGDDLYDPEWLDKLSWNGPQRFQRPFQSYMLVLLDMRNRIEKKFGDEGVSFFNDVFYQEALKASKVLAEREKIEAKDCKSVAQLSIINDGILGYEEVVVKSEPKEARLNITYCPLQPALAGNDCRKFCPALLLKDGFVAGINPAIKWSLEGKTISAGAEACQLRFWIE